MNVHSINRVPWTTRMACFGSRIDVCVTYYGVLYRDLLPDKQCLMKHWCRMLRTDVYRSLYDVRDVFNFPPVRLAGYYWVEKGKKSQNQSVVMSFAIVETLLASRYPGPNRASMRLRLGEVVYEYTHLNR
jgi:hypothetical protein